MQLFLLLVACPAALAGTKSFVCLGDADWTQDNCWSGASKPTDGDDVVISHPTATYTVKATGITISLNSLTIGGTGKGSQTLHLFNSNLTLAAASSIAKNGKLDIEIADNFVGGAAVLSSEGEIDFQIGHIALTQLVSNGKFSFSNAAAKYIAGTEIVLSGASTWSAGPLFLSQKASIHVASKGSLEVGKSSGPIANPDADTSLVVDGTMSLLAAKNFANKLSISGKVTVAASLGDKALWIQAPHGSLELTGTKASLEIADSSTASIQTPGNTVAKGSSIDGDGDLEIAAGALTVSGDMNVKNVFMVGAGTLSIASNCSVVALSVKEASTFEVLGGAGVKVSSMTWAFGTLQGAGDIAVDALVMTGKDPKHFKGATLTVGSGSASNDGVAAQIVMDTGKMIVPDLSKFSFADYTIQGSWAFSASGVSGGVSGMTITGTSPAKEATHVVESEKIEL